MASDPRESLLPLYDQVAKCGKCGFCQPACPVYRTTYREAHVARGKHALIRGVLEGETVLDRELRDAFDNCLLCRACTASCFSDLPTDRLVIEFRQAYARRFGRPMVQRFLFRRLLPHRRRMRAVVRLLWAARESGLEGLAVRWGLVDMVNPKLRKALALREGVPGPFLRERLDRRATQPEDPADESQSVRESARESAHVGYWISCGYEYMLPETGEAAVGALRWAGSSVEVLPNVCCGLPVYGYGDLEGARDLARLNISALGDVDRFGAVVSDCASCSSHLKGYGDLLADDPDFAGRAAEVSAKVRAFSEFLALAPAGDEGGTVGEGGGVRRTDSSDEPGAEEEVASSAAPTVVTFHEPCHLGARYQGVVREPRELLRSIPGVEYRELPDADRCCGSAGSYVLLNPETSGAILARKMENVAATGAEILVTECPSCMLQLELGVRRAGLDVRVMGLADLLLTMGLGSRS